MPILPNVRWERFCKAYVRDGNARASYATAGYRPHDGNASRLRGTEQVRRRIDELRAMQGVKHRITVDSLLSDLAQDRDLARRLEQPGAALQATQLMAKLTGFLVDRKETGSPGDFAALQTRDDVIARVRQEMGDDAVRLLEQLLTISDAPAPSGDDVN
jgi:phage terminase small subunit